MRYSDGGVWDLSQKVHQVTCAVVYYPPVSREAPDAQDYITNINNTTF